MFRKKMYVAIISYDTKFQCFNFLICISSKVKERLEENR